MSFLHKNACLLRSIKRICTLVGNIVSYALISCQEASSERSKQTTPGAKTAVNNALPSYLLIFWMLFLLQPDETEQDKASTDKAAGVFCVWMAQGGADLICSIGVQCRVDFWLTLQLWPDCEGWHGMRKSKRMWFISGIILSLIHFHILQLHIHLKTITSSLRLSVAQSLW